MQATRRTTGIALTLGAAALALYLLWLWQPGRQLLLHQRHFLAALEKRDWDRVTSFFDEGYGDRWGLDRQSAVRMTSEVLRQFFVVEILAEDLQGSVDSRHGVVYARIRLDGEGNAIAREAIHRVNALRKPFRFEWRHASWKPWDWRLVRVDQQELRIPRNAFDYI